MTDNPELEEDLPEDNEWHVEFTAVVEGAEDAAQAASTARNAVARGEVDCWVTAPDEFPVRVDGDGNIFAMTDEDIDPEVAAEWESWDDADEESEE